MLFEALRERAMGLLIGLTMLGACGRAAGGPATARVSTPTQVPPPNVGAAVVEGFASFAARTERDCKSGEEAISIDAVKIQHNAMNDCLAARLQVPALAKTTSEREDAAFVRFARLFAETVEKIAWISLQWSTTSPGSGIGSFRLSCETSAFVERGYWQLARSAGAVPALVARVEALSAAGQVSRKGLLRVSDAATRWMAPGATVPEPQSEDWSMPVDVEEWRSVRRGIQDIESQAATLATSTCATIPGLEQALGRECKRGVELYYLGHCTFDVAE